MQGPSSTTADALSPDVKKQLMDVFTMLDRTGSLQIGQREILYLLNKLLGKNCDEMLVSEIMSELLDSDAPGVGIDFETFCKALGPVIANASEDKLNDRAFAAIDADGSGCINTVELAPLMSAVAGNMPDSKVKEVLDLAAGKDGKMRKPDFIKAVTK